MSQAMREDVAFGFDDVIPNGLDGLLGTIPNISLPTLTTYQAIHSSPPQQATQYLAGIITASLFQLQSSAASTWSPQAAEFFEVTLRTLVRWATPTIEDRRAREGVITRLSGLAESGIRFCRGLHISAYGSFTSGLYTPHGDLDLSIEGVAIMQDDYTGDRWQVPVEDMQRKERENFLKALAHRVGARGAQKLLRLTHARVPIIKFEDHVTGVEVDVAIDSIGAQFKSVAIGIAASMDWRVGALVRLIKLWARHNNLNDSSTGTFNSFALTMLVIFHCQTRSPAILPPLCELFGCISSNSKGGAVSVGGVVSNPEERPMHDHSRPDLNRLRDLQHEVNFRGAAAAAANIQNHTLKRNQETLLELLSSFFAMFQGLMNGWCGPDEALSRVLRRVRVDTWNGCLTYAQWTDKKDGVYNCSIEDPFDSTDNVGRTIRDSGCIDRIKQSLDDAVDIFASSVSIHSFEEGLERLFGSEILTLAYFHDQKLIESGELKDTTAPILPTALWIPGSLKGYVARTQPFVDPEKNMRRTGGGSSSGDGGGVTIRADVFSPDAFLEYPKLSFHNKSPFATVATILTDPATAMELAITGTGSDVSSSSVEMGEDEDQGQIDEKYRDLGMCTHWDGLKVLRKEADLVLNKEYAEEVAREAEKAANRAAKKAAKNLQKDMKKQQEVKTTHKLSEQKIKESQVSNTVILETSKSTQISKDTQPPVPPAPPVVEGKTGIIENRRHRRRQRRRHEGGGRSGGDANNTNGEGNNNGGGGGNGRRVRKQPRPATGASVLVVPRQRPPPPPGM